MNKIVRMLQSNNVGFTRFLLYQFSLYYNGLRERVIKVFVLVGFSMTDVVRCRRIRYDVLYIISKGYVPIFRWALSRLKGKYFL